MSLTRSDHKGLQRRIVLFAIQVIVNLDGFMQIGHVRLQMLDKLVKRLENPVHLNAVQRESVLVAGKHPLPKPSLFRMPRKMIEGNRFLHNCNSILTFMNRNTDTSKKPNDSSSYSAKAQHDSRNIIGRRTKPSKGKRIVVLFVV